MTRKTTLAKEVVARLPAYVHKTAILVGDDGSSQSIDFYWMSSDEWKAGNRNPAEWAVFEVGNFVSATRLVL